MLLTRPLVLRASDSANFYRRLTTDKGHCFGNILTRLLLPASNHTLRCSLYFSFLFVFSALFQRLLSTGALSCPPLWHSRLAALRGEIDILWLLLHSLVDVIANRSKIKRVRMFPKR